MSTESPPRTRSIVLQDTLTYADLGTFNREKLESAIRARVQTVHLGGARVLARVLGGPKMFLSTDDLGFGCHVMLDGYWESWLTVFFARFISPGMTVFDVGANFGMALNSARKRKSRFFEERKKMVNIRIRNF